jgi:hypothetical protein
MKVFYLVFALLETSGFLSLILSSSSDDGLLSPHNTAKNAVACGAIVVSAAAMITAILIQAARSEKYSGAGALPNHTIQPSKGRKGRI